jgi:LCP family protein required for cell wall assembly
MVISIDEKKQKIKVTSLMRDMYIPIPGKGNNRINAAYALGGSSLAIKTINTNFGLDIKDYVMVDFFGLEKLIDTVGGVKINVSDAEAGVLNDYEDEINNLTGSKVPKIKGGNQTLNGRQAVAYCRIRYVGNADYERTERQRRVLNELLRKVKQGGIIKLPKTISTLLPYVKTSLSVGEVLKLGLKAVGFKTDNIEQYRLPVDGTYKSQYISEMAVLVPNIEENRKKLYEFIYGIK